MRPPFLALLLLIAVGCGPSAPPDAPPLAPPPGTAPVPDEPVAPGSDPVGDPVADPVAGPAGEPAPRPDGRGTCPEGRLVRPGWQGEYPAPIIHIQADDPLPARSTPCAAAPDRTCRPEPGLYHPWSRHRPPSPEDPFVTVRGVDRWLFLKDHRLPGAPPAEAAVPKGAILEVLFYAGEGYCDQRIVGGGESFVEPCPEMWAEGIALEQSEASGETQLFSVACADGGRAWLEGAPSLFEHASVAEGELIEFGVVGPAGGGTCGVLVMRSRFGTFETAGRTVEGLMTDNQRYTQLIGEALGEAVQLDGLWRVDLQGDGTDEILFEAVGAQTSIRTLGVRRVIEGAAQTRVVAISGPSGSRTRLHGLADVDRDGTLELVTEEDTASGPGLAAWSLAGAEPTRADDERCGW